MPIGRIAPTLLQIPMTPRPARPLSRDPLRLALCLPALALLPVTARAYIDPGTGSLVFQSLLAALFGVGVAWRKLRSWAARALPRRRPLAGRQ